MKEKQQKFLTIKNEIFLVSFLFLALVSLIFGGILLKSLYDNSIASARNALKQCNSQIVIYTESMFHENASIVELLAQNPKVILGQQNAPELLALYHEISSRNNNITYVCSGYTDGRLLINDYPAPADYDATTRPWYQAALETDGVTGLVYEDTVTGEWLFNQCTKLVDDDQKLVGVVSVDCSNENISNQLRTKYQYESQRSYIINPDGTVLIHPQNQYINDFLPNYMSTQGWQDVLKDRTNYGEYEKDGIKSIAYFEWIPETDFIVVTAIDAAEVVNPIVKNLFYLLVLIVVISIILGFGLSYLLTRRLARPVIALESRLHNVAAGLPVTKQDFSSSNVEIAGIADSIEVIVADIAKHEEQRRTAEYLSFHDSMTGVYNRRFFTEKLKDLNRQHCYPLCLISCDINGLKVFNDVFGHDAGDELINKVAESLRGACRADDILARMGGDEFSILMPRVTELRVQDILHSIRVGVAAKKVCGVGISVSIGYSILEAEGDSTDKLQQHADEMMYGQKMREREQVRQEMRTGVIEMARRENHVKVLTDQEQGVLSHLARTLCPNLETQIKQSYWLRNVGKCTAFQPDDNNHGKEGLHTEISCRILSVFDDCREAADDVLHFTEHWDGSGCPAGLAGREIPLVSRIIAVADAYFMGNGSMELLDAQRAWYDPDVVSALQHYHEMKQRG